VKKCAGPGFRATTSSREEPKRVGSLPGRLPAPVSFSLVVTEANSPARVLQCNVSVSDFLPAGQGATLGPRRQRGVLV
jgi:hypothetical protein